MSEPDLLALLRRDPYGHTFHVEVVRDGETLLAWHRRDPEAAYDVYSITKSVVSTLVGIALGDGLVELDAPVAELLPDLALEPRCTVRHLLTMTAGRATGGAYEIDEVMALPGGWLERLAAAPQLRPPGEAFSYDNGAAHVLAAALAAAVGRPLERFAEERLFAPLGFAGWEWPLDPDGRAYGFGHLRLRPRDLLELGRLVLDGGRGLLPSAYLAEATRPQTRGGPPEGVGYGFLWWVDDRRPLPYAFAGGYAGQSLLVAPRRGLVAVTLGAEEELRPGWRSARGLVVERFLR